MQECGVIDERGEWLAAWRGRLERIGATHLRTPVNQCPGKPGALHAFIKREGSEKVCWIPSGSEEGVTGGHKGHRVSQGSQRVCWVLPWAVTQIPEIAESEFRECRIMSEWMRKDSEGDMKDDFNTPDV